MSAVLFEAKKPWWYELRLRTLIFLCLLPVLVLANLAGSPFAGFINLLASAHVVALLVAGRRGYRNGGPIILRVQTDVVESVGPHSRVEAPEVEALEWDGIDNVGIRLKDGRVVQVPFLPVPERERESAHAAILDFIRGAREAAEQEAAAGGRSS